MLSLLAPAKINLVLEVLGKRNDGYHEIRSLMQTVSLCDVLSFKLAEGVSLECDQPSLQNKDNLVLRAAELLREACACSKGVNIKLEKRIPHGSGLGGGSSDAAVTLLALNKLWALELSLSELVALGIRLGSDVPFFFHRGTALVEGRGERVTPVSQSLPQWFVLLIPPLPRPPQKTKQLYSRLNKSHYTNGSQTARALEALPGTGQLPSSLLYNVFDAIALEAFPGLEEYWGILERIGATNIHLAGSGPTLFAATAIEARAEKWHQQLQEQGLESYCISTLDSQVA
ncbi:MAG: 4-(cytidine 5'-diphospho)-2-C-methyl-D-erythritol kinase [Chloroflexi bacterium]|nr:4-(cytidine 5'-diphospho)-2-C-methyl-D-erythritol kinase [Chloroflexota bacterium]MBM4453556.1 4-(cytidine 5'-diphospho)-2-C-methyl-D-erythritol kinase [Chloroflexota bacterium]